MVRVLAIAELRTRLALRSMRGRAGAASLVGAILLASAVGVMALGVALGLAIFVYGAPRSDHGDLELISYLVAFYALLVVGIVMPLLSGVIHEGLDVASLRRFPIGRWQLFGMQLAASLGNPEHLFCYPALVAVVSVAVLANGVPAFPALLLAGCALLVNVVWGNALTLWLAGIMRRRRIKEIVTIVVLAVVVGLSVVPALLHSDEKKLALVPLVEKYLGPTIGIGRALPPTQVAQGFGDLQAGEPSTTAGHLGWLALWILGGVALGYRVFSRYHLGDRDHSRRAARRRPSRERKPRRPTFDHPLWSFVPIEVRAVAAKDLHYLFRSVAGRFSLLVAPVVVAIVATLAGKLVERPLLGMDPSKLLLLGMLVYVLLFSSNMVNNAFAWEAEGAKAYFISPVRLEAVIAGKNLAIWIYNGVLLFLCLGTWVALTGLPDALTLLVALLVFTFALLAFTSLGNLLSVLFPVRRDMSAMKNQPSQVAVLCSLLGLVVIGVVTSVFLALPVLFGAETLQPVSLLVALALQGVAYRGTLGLSAQLLRRRRERFLAALRSLR